MALNEPRDIRRVAIMMLRNQLAKHAFDDRYTSKVRICFKNYTSKLVVAVVAVIAWQLDLSLPMQSVPITTDIVSLNLDQGEVYNIM